jgi:uncharacterized membrane protein HdeD (DUF308 family)
MIVAALLAVGGVIEVSTPFLSTQMSPAAFGWFSIGVAVVMALLRLSTTKSLSEKGTKK